MSANMQFKKVRLGDLLVEKKLISEASLMTALAEQKKTGRKLGRILVDDGFVEEGAMLQALSAQLNIPYVDLTTFELNSALVQLLPETDARRYRAIVLKETLDGLMVGMGDPTDIISYDKLVAALNRPVELAMIKESDLLRNVDQLPGAVIDFSTDQLHDHQIISHDQSPPCSRSFPTSCSTISSSSPSSISAPSPLGGRKISSTVTIVPAVPTVEASSPSALAS